MGSDTNKQSLDVYIGHFETPITTDTEKYYKTESEASLAENSVPDYLKKAEERLIEEDRVDHYPNTITRKTLISKYEHVLFRSRDDVEEFRKMLEFDKDLQRIYLLVLRTPEDLEPLRKKLEENVKQAGLSAVEVLASGGEAASKERIDPKEYINALLLVHRRTARLSSAAFVARLASLPVWIRHTASSWDRIPQQTRRLLARHADSLL